MQDVMSPVSLPSFLVWMFWREESLLSLGLVSRIMFDVMSIRNMNFVEMRKKVLHCAFGF